MERRSQPRNTPSLQGFYGIDIGFQYLGNLRITFALNGQKENLTLLGRHLVNGKKQLTVNFFLVQGNGMVFQSHLTIFPPQPLLMTHSHIQMTQDGEATVSHCIEEISAQMTFGFKSVTLLLGVQQHILHGILGFRTLTQ